MSQDLVIRTSAHGMRRVMWTLELEVELRRLWIEGKSATEIAKAFGGKVTRSAVLGKARRLDLASRDQSTAASSHNRARWESYYAAAEKERPAKKKAEPTAKTQRPPQNGGLAAFNAVRRANAPLGPDLAATIAPHVIPATARPWTSRRFGECAFPVAGLGAETVSCCGPTDGGPYCAGHRAVMYQKPPTKAQRAHMAKMREARRQAARAA